VNTISQNKKPKIPSDLLLFPVVVGIFIFLEFSAINKTVNIVLFLERAKFLNSTLGDFKRISLTPRPKDSVEIWQNFSGARDLKKFQNSYFFCDQRRFGSIRLKRKNEMKFINLISEYENFEKIFGQLTKDNFIKGNFGSLLLSFSDIKTISVNNAFKGKEFEEIITFNF
jgi:hypothetical protein